jgi:hypothetical protein
MAQEKTKENTFHLGLTMAGAVSAGCYTAGVMDYLFEVLDLWERAKKGEKIMDHEGNPIDDKLIPKHNVVIRAMGGASAGGMATIMSSIYALGGKVNPVKEVPKDPRQRFNILYDSWVHLDDDNTGKKEDKLSFEKIWDTDDLEGPNAKVESLFNTKVIDNIAENAFKFKDKPDLKQQADKLPSYISKDMEVLLSHTLLRGIPLQVGFKAKGKMKSDSPNHTTFEHFLVSHFKLNQGEEVNCDQHLWLNPYVKEHKDRMILSTISTGAFPVGLKFRKFNKDQFSDNYIKAATKRLVFGNFGEDNPDKDERMNLLSGIEDKEKQFHSINLKDFESITIDGGAINNEPYREVASILKTHYDKLDDENGYQNYGMIMIDPFPDSYKGAQPDPDVSDIMGVVPKIIGTLLDQSRVKRQEIIDQFSNDYYRGIIYPSKFKISEEKSSDGKTIRKVHGRHEYPIACSSFHAFGGFLDINFRVHDFFLGRDNARNYIRQHFCMPYNPEEGVVHPIHKNWTEEAIKRFKVTKYKVDYLPVIPDLNMIVDDRNAKEDWNLYTINEKPDYQPQDLMDLKPKIEARFNKIFELLESQVMSGGKKEAKPAANAITTHWMGTIAKKPTLIRRLLSSLSSPFAPLVKKMIMGRAKKELIQRLTKGTLETILADLVKKDLIRDDRSHARNIILKMIGEQKPENVLDLKNITEALNEESLLTIPGEAFTQDTAKVLYQEVLDELKKGVNKQL